MGNVESVRLNPLKKKVLKSVIYADMVAMADLVSAVQGLKQSIQNRISYAETYTHDSVVICELQDCLHFVEYWLADVVKEVE